MNDAPSLFRIILQVSDLDLASSFYSVLLGIEGRTIRGGRTYFDCGPVILALVDVAAGGEEARPLPDNIYLAVNDLGSGSRTGVGPRLPVGLGMSTVLLQAR